MSISTRRKLGMLLLAISALAVLAFLAFGIFHGRWQYVGGGASGDSCWLAFSGELGLSKYYLIPISLCGVVGLLCLVWSSPKPPKLPG